ncbi:hypothetical protein GQ43DRAFT_440545 [Delitschia confertaspora ATCC 74209]|uniref:Uncharacterized protein n=1 Tax=Delitschia confertaspora ATCC 74209 TaxID=1513339 RepID=A0A9P4MSJ4_9PLEO|nr:hypothetical protein GQ43DRAFT_440545 [Delitschia confertaspora ATCC 74209]
MSARTPAFWRLLHTQTLRQTCPQLSRSYHQLSQSQVRQVTSVHTTTRGAQWTRYTTSYSLSSVRTFSAAHALRRPEESGTDVPASSPGAARQIDEVMEEIQELYGTARDEFEIAAEETEKNTTYAPDDRAAAREEVDKLLQFYNRVMEGGDRAVAEEVKRRVGQRVRELEQAMGGLEEAAQNHD